MRKVMCCVILFFFAWSAHSVEVRWDCFQTHELEEADGIGCYYVDSGYSSPEIGLRYFHDMGGSKLTRFDGKGDTNVGWNLAVWVLAAENDLLNRAYFEMPHIVLKDSYNTQVPTPLALNSIGDTVTIGNGDVVCLAAIGNYYDDNGMPQDYFAWAQMASDGQELKLLRSAFSYGELIVGGGAIPEPSCALLVLVGLTALALRRQVKISCEI